jgi:predicted deacylase
MQHADYMIDVHTPTTGGRYAPFAFLPPGRVGAAVADSERLATAFGADFILAAEEGVYVLPGSPHVVLAERGAIAIGVEIGEGGRVEPEVTERGLRGLRNVLREVGMLPAGNEPIGRRMVISDMIPVRARRAGLVTRLVELNEQVSEGQVVATVTNLYGELVEEIRAPLSGPVVRVATFPMVSTGERIIQLGVPR